MTQWLRQLSQGNHEAAANLWQRYGTSLERLARRRYSAALSPASGDDDLAQSVFFVLWKGVSEGRWNDLQDRDELWWLLLEITRRKAMARVSRQQTQKRRGLLASAGETESSPGDGSPLNLDPLDVREMSPEFVVTLKDELDHLLGLLPDELLCEITRCKLEGLTHEEIAVRFHISRRTVIRKLNLVRDCWSQEVA